MLCCSEAGEGKDEEGQGGEEAEDGEEHKEADKEAGPMGSGARKRKGRGSGGPCVTYAKARNQMRGHTAFLTFASAGMSFGDEGKGADEGGKAEGTQAAAGGGSA